TAIILIANLDSRVLRCSPTRRSSDLNRVKKTSHRLQQIFEREPTQEEVAKAMCVTLAKVRQMQDVSRHPMSLESPVGSEGDAFLDRKSTRLNSSHVKSSYAVFCLKR